MCFNPSKCSVLRVSRPKSKNLEFQYTLKGETLENVPSTPYLGVCLSETLEWEAHINKITSKANSTLGFLRRNLKACPPKLRETAYFSLVRSSLEYSSAVWDPFRQKDIDKLEKIQRAAARFVTQNYRQTASVTSLIQNLGWTDLKTRRKNSRLLCMFKILNELVEIPINDRLIPADRTQKVVVDGSSSESARVKSGVPQGTVLGPLLFLTYINDLPSTVSSQVRLFADDCLLYRPIKCRADQEKLQRDLSALQDWADRWGMCFNPSKCSVRRVSRPKSKNLEFQYTLKGETLENVPSTPYLGVCLSETLEWEAHINKITSKANSTLGFLRRNLKACPPKLRETAYFSLVRSSLEYSSAVWDPFRQKEIDKLEKIQRAAARFVTQNYRQTASVTSLIQNLGWTDLKTRRKNSRLLCML